MSDRASAAPQFVQVRWDGGDHRIEHVWLNGQRRDQPLLVFLHEGLGSVSMWRDFPELLCKAADCRGLVFSRWGYGASTPRGAGERWPVDFMHAQAESFLPALFAALDIDTAFDRPWFYGHSDGGSIALLYAAAFPARVAGLAVAAPHIFVEDLSIRSISQARAAYLAADLRSKLARHHADPDSAFWGWNDAWLDPRFQAWSIVDRLPSIACPLLAIQGEDDEYGTMTQIDGIAHAVPQTQLLRLARCGHSPHRDQPSAVIQAVERLLRHAMPSFSKPGDTR
jgi:pimeloyl-ACP methyl ester carboxylesterase